MGRERRLLQMLVAGMTAFAAAGAQPDPARPSLFNLEGDRVARIVAMTPASAHAPDRAQPDLSSPMLGRIEGVLAEPEGRDFSAIITSAPARPRPVTPRGEPAVFARLMLVGRVATRQVDILRSEDGLLLARAVKTGADAIPRRNPWDEESLASLQLLDRAAFAAVSDGWPRYLGAFEAGPPDAPAGELARPYMPGRFHVDAELLRARIAGGKRVKAEPASRALSLESFAVRRPRGYDPRFPAGVLVWINPGEGAEFPAQLAAAADRLGLVLVAAERCGNNREAANRIQLAFDLLATAERDLHIDPRRVYIGGLSGGGRLASILWGCFPDVFAGAIAVAGVSSYHTVPSGYGSAWSPAYDKPDGARWTALGKTRLAALSGPGDFNFREVSVKAQLLADDGLSVRVFQDPDMGHAMPRAEFIGQALEWLDEPYRRLRTEEERTASDLLARAGPVDPAKGPTPKQKQTLVEATRIGPWTPAAWKSAELLGTPRRSPQQGDLVDE